MSALPPKADMLTTGIDVRFVPTGDIVSGSLEDRLLAVLNKMANDCSQHLWSFPRDVLE
jgi:hypothetical protein